MTKTEYTMLIFRILDKMEKTSGIHFDEPENGMDLVNTLQAVVDEIKQVVDLYNKEKV